MENLNSKMDYEKLVAALNKQELVNGNLEISEKLAETAQIEWYDPLVQVFTINAKLYRWYGVSDPYHYFRVFKRTSMYIAPKTAQLK